MFDKLEDILIRLVEIINELNEPNVAGDTNRFQKLMKEQAELQPIADAYNEYKKCNETVEESLMMLEDEKEKVLTVLKKALSGSVGKNLLDIRFKTSQVSGSIEHKLLMDLRDDLKNEDLRMALYQKIIENIHFDDGFLILLGCDRYDVPFKSKDDAIQSDNSDEVYTYLLCAVCPVKQTKPALRYIAETKEFKAIIPGRTLNEISKILQDDEEDIIIGVSKNQGVFEMPNCRAVTRILEGEFLDYRNVIPKEKELRVTVDKNLLISSFSTINILSK